MPSFSRHSLQELSTCHADLQKIARIAINLMDFRVIEGQRDLIRQRELFDQGLSKAEPGKSKHNRFPSEAFDFAPYPLHYGDDTWITPAIRPADDLPFWEDFHREKMAGKRYYYQGGILRGIALGLGIKVRIGSDWDDDGEIIDQRFHDLGHIELI